MVPFGRSVHPSSSNGSILPVPARAVHVSVTGSNFAIRLSIGLARMNAPDGNTVHCASPIVFQPAGGARTDQLFATGSYTAPLFVKANEPRLYSPPVTTIRPSAMTAEAK